MVQHLDLTARDVLREVSLPETCIIADGLLSFLIDAGKDIGAPVLVFHTIGAFAFWTIFCVPLLIEAGEVPIRGNEDLNRIITTIPGMEGLLRFRDLQRQLRSPEQTEFLLYYGTIPTRHATKAQGLILNTFGALEDPILSHIQAHCAKIYTVSPLDAHLRSRFLAANKVPPTHHFSSSLWEEDKSCIQWLDKQPVKSVVYVSFGSMVVLQREELMELWHGLFNSKSRFLWVIRPDSVGSYSETVAKLKAASKDRGCIVEWAPQGEVLAHTAIGGFLTHSGWNSTIESMTAGVPMLCWPNFADQHINSRLVSESWRIGLDMKDVRDRATIERMINDLMVGKRDELVTSAADKARLAREAIVNGGSSWTSLDRLIEDIRTMTVGKGKETRRLSSN